MNADQLKNLSVATKGEVYDHEYGEGEWMHRTVETHETIEQFIESSKNWQERSAPKFGEIAGLKFIVWSNMQANKGQSRDSLSLIDFGDIRVAVSIDLTYFI